MSVCLVPRNVVRQKSGKLGPPMTPSLCGVDIRYKDILCLTKCGFLSDMALLQMTLYLTFTEQKLHGVSLRDMVLV